MARGKLSARELQAIGLKPVPKQLAARFNKLAKSNRTRAATVGETYWFTYEYYGQVWADVYYSGPFQPNGDPVLPLQQLQDLRSARQQLHRLERLHPQRQHRHKRHLLLLRPSLRLQSGLGRVSALRLRSLLRMMDDARTLPIGSRARRLEPSAVGCEPPTALVVKTPQ